MTASAPGSAPGDSILRDVAVGDIPIFYNHQLDPDANWMAGFPARDWDAFTTHWTKILADETVTTQTVLSGSEVAGNLVSWEEDDHLLVGYWIGKEYWGKGLATRALSEFLGRIRTRPLYAHVAKHNVASFRVLQKCGFSVCGEDTVPADVAGQEIEEYILMLPDRPVAPT